MKQLVFRLRTVLGITALVLASSNVASATVIHEQGNIPQTDENILFNGAGTDDTGNPVIGRGNQTSFLFAFNSSTTLSASSSGQAEVEGDFSDITLSMLDPTFGFTSAIFNLNAGVAGSVDINVSWVSPTGSAVESETFAVNVNNPGNPNTGQNFFTITAIDDQVIANISIVSDNPLVDIRQVRIGGRELLPDPGDPVVPEPISMSLFGSGLCGLVLWRKFKRSR
jgi:PEP-CTERM motif